MMSNRVDISTFYADKSVHVYHNDASKLKSLPYMVHSSITDHIDRDGAKSCNSNLPYPMLMKLSGRTNSLLSCVVL